MNKKITLWKKARSFRIFCHYIGMIKIEKDISIYREILKDSDLTAVERKAIYRRIDSLLQELESIKLEKAVANLASLCKDSPTFPSGSVGGSQTCFK